MNILIVEDNPETASTLLENILSWNHSGETSDTGQGALKKLEEKDFDLVIIDIYLPDCLGHHMIPRFREISPDVGIITMTGRNSRELELEVRKQGILFYMIKPFETKHLRSLLACFSKRESVRLPYRITEVQSR